MKAARRIADVIPPSGSRLVRGIDIAAKHRDIDHLARAYWRMPTTQDFIRRQIRNGKKGRRVEVDDFVQDVLLTIHRRNSMASAYNPQHVGREGRVGASLSKYVYLICFTVLEHALRCAEPEQLLPEGEELRVEAVTMGSDCDSEVLTPAHISALRGLAERARK